MHGLPYCGAGNLELRRQLDLRQPCAGLKDAGQELLAENIDGLRLGAQLDEGLHERLPLCLK
jgi:hypothetical protein